MKNKILSLFSDSIPYIKELREIAGSVTATILMQQLDYRFAQKPDGFYKYVEPPKSHSSLYREGDSWIEETGFSAEEFKSAFDKIGVSYKSKTDFQQAIQNNVVFEDEEGNEKFYARYFDRHVGISFYYRNHELLDEKLIVVNQGCRFPRNHDSRFLETVHVGFPYNIRNTENTTEIEDTVFQKTEEKDEDIFSNVRTASEAPATKTKTKTTKGKKIDVTKGCHLPLDITVNSDILEAATNLGYERQDIFDEFNIFRAYYTVGKGKKLKQPNWYQKFIDEWLYNSYKYGRLKRNGKFYKLGANEQRLESVRELSDPNLFAHITD